MQENLSSGFANNKDANQPVQMCSAFVIHLLEKTVSKFATREISLYPPQTLFVVGILFSRCPSVRLFGVRLSVCNVLFP